MYANYEAKFNSKKMKRARSKWHRAAIKVDYFARMVHAHRKDKKLINKLRSELDAAKEAESLANEEYIGAKSKAGILAGGKYADY